MSLFTFNRNKYRAAGTIDQPSEELVANTLGLFNASVDDALKFGGDLTRAALGAMNLRGDRKHIVVDVKVHMLLPGQCPAIPGWHTDGVPRHEDGSPASGGLPNLFQQDAYGDSRAPRYHLLVTGAHCLTEFVDGVDVQLDIPDDVARSAGLYRWMTREIGRRVESGEVQSSAAPSCQVLEWDWWNIHRGIKATGREWRYLIRVTETDFLAPERDLRRIIRTQQNVYVPEEFGW